jgi:hypothetical protein
MSMSTVLKDKHKFQPRKRHEALEREHRYSCTVCLNLALYVGGWGYPYCNGLVSTEMVISVQSD